MTMPNIGRMLLVDGAAQGQSSACGEEGNQHNDRGEGERRGNTEFNPGRNTSQASGITISPATRACIIPAKTFSIAIQATSIGARSRSSISRVH